MLSVEKTQFVITEFESSCLFFTSTFNIFPILLAFSKNIWFYSFLSFGTSLFSLLYWWNPIHGWRRTVDIYYAKFTFLVYLGSGIYYIPYGIPAFLLYLGAFSIFLSYGMNYVFPKIWLRFHLMVHLLSIIMKLYILCFVEEYVDKSFLYDIV